MTETHPPPLRPDTPPIAGGQHGQVPRSRRVVVAALGWLRRDLNWLLLAALLAGADLRLRLAHSLYGSVDADQAVIYLMARHVLHGQFHVFYWGQPYGGTLLPTVLGAVFLLTGPHLWVMIVLEAVLAAGVTLLVRSVARALWGTRTGNVAAALFWVGPAAWIYLSMHDAVYELFGLLTLLGSIRLLLGYRRHRHWWLLALSGLVLGLGWWTTPFILLTLPSVLVVLWVTRPGWRALAAGTASAVVGAAPWLAFNARNHWSSLRPTAPGGLRPLHVANVAWLTTTRLLPAGLDGLRFLQGRQLSRPVAITIGLALLVALSVGGLVRLARRNIPDVVVHLTALWWIALIAVLGLVTAPLAARYVAFVLVPLWMIIARLFRRSWSGTAAVAVTVAVTFTALHGSGALRAVRNGDPLRNVEVAAVANYLIAHDRLDVWGDYVVANRLTAQTQETIVAASIHPQRYPPYSALATAAADTTYVVVSGCRNDALLRSVAAGAGAQRVRLGTLIIYLFPEQFDPPQVPGGLGPACRPLPTG